MSVDAGTGFNLTAPATFMNVWDIHSGVVLTGYTALNAQGQPVADALLRGNAAARNGSDRDTVDL